MKKYPLVLAGLALAGLVYFGRDVDKPYNEKIQTSIEKVQKTERLESAKQPYHSLKPIISQAIRQEDAISNKMPFEKAEDFIAYVNGLDEKEMVEEDFFELLIRAEKYGPEAEKAVFAKLNKRESEVRGEGSYIDFIQRLYDYGNYAEAAKLAEWYEKRFELGVEQEPGPEPEKIFLDCFFYYIQGLAKNEHKMDMYYLTNAYVCARHIKTEYPEMRSFANFFAPQIFQGRGEPIADILWSNILGMAEVLDPQTLYDCIYGLKVYGDFERAKELEDIFNQRFPNAKIRQEWIEGTNLIKTIVSVENNQGQ
ncbi:MAG: hypothetical protein QXP39_03035 [Candidatus Aenigmatarchaeota archaeon]